MATRLSLRSARDALRGVERAAVIAARPAVDDGLAVLRAGVERRCPRDTGALRRGISVREASRRGREGYVGGAVVVSADHVASVEFGDVDQPANPFLRRTADADGRRAADAVASGLAQRI